MQVSSSVSNRYYTPYQTNTSVKYCAGFSQTENGKLTPNETTENPGFAEFVDYQEFHKAWMSQGAETAFSYTSNNGFNAEANSISLVSGMSVRLSNGFRLAIGDYMVQALGDFKDNQAASESAAIAGALSHLIKVANGQIPMNMFYSKNQDNSAYAKIGLQAFGIDTSRPFTINEKTFHFDSDGQIRLGRGQYVNGEYETSIVPDETEVYAAKQAGAVSIAETEDEGEFLGLTMVPEEGQSVTYGMRAMLSEKSTPDNPIVQVVSNLGGKKVIYNVEVNKVNPNNATQLEMFALLSYTDKMGITDGGTFGSHQQLEVYGGNASSIGYCGSLSGEDVFLNERFDWAAIMEKMVQVYKDAGIENQAEDCKALFDFFATYTENNEVKDNTVIDFSRFAPNAPEEVKQAFMEAAEETGYNEGERMDYLSQVFIHQVENRQNGVADYTDVFGGSIASALQAAKEILYDLENPLMPISQRGKNAAKYVEQEKEFYRAFIEKLEGLTGTDTVDTEETVDYAKILEEKINEIFAKIQNGDTEASYQIGSQSFTEKEWEEFLDKFDSVEEAIQELMKEEQARKEAEEARKEDVFTNDASTLLTTESTSCVYETADPNDDDIRYITWYTEEGIFCRKAGQTEGYEWSITFENKEQYDKVMEFIGQFPSDWNMRFAAHENFWNDFLNDEIDMEGFMEFINGTNKGVPDYSITVGDSMYIDTDKMQWAKYTNPLGTRFYTAEEMHQMQMEIIAANEEKLKAQQVSYEEMYKRTHPDYNGERIFRTISGGQ
ncbi:MAG: hypothetical protein E7284_12390, partial [Lachnospiraceae bacterium]|nr:hypothetical protein [Lachnospiraceae bacterium]